LVPRKVGKVCIVPGCGRVERQRGLCNACRNFAWRLMSSGTMTDAEAVRVGKMRPSENKVNKVAMDWFKGVGHCPTCKCQTH
jgi:hypothetical protein